MKPKNPDSEEWQQIFVCQWLKREYPDVWFYAVPNGGYRGKKEAGMLKAGGASAGVPDLCFPGLFLYVEMKKEKGGVVSDSQKRWLRGLESFGYTVAIAKGFEDFKNVFKAIYEAPRKRLV